MSTDAPSSIEDFIGTWQLISAITDGQAAPDATIQSVRVVIAQGTHTVYFGDQVVAHAIPFHIDCMVTPHTTIDTLPDGQYIKGITRLEGDILTSCVAGVGQERPMAFAAPPGSGHTLRVFKRLLA